MSREAGAASKPTAGESAPPDHTRARGAAAETVAVEWLLGHGYEIVERNHRNGAGELDVIARDGDTLCFVEVKARENDLCGHAVEGVSVRQQRRIVRAGAFYLAQTGWPGPCRFDVLGLDRQGAETAWRFTLLRDAFEAG